MIFVAIGSDLDGNELRGWSTKTQKTIRKNMKKCNICKNEVFDLGPNGRKSFDGFSLPRCTKCQSLERHRALRDFWLHLPLKYLLSKNVLQFSTDLSVDKTWFNSYEVSIYGGENSIDLQNINRSDASYDIINCVHVLEHVPEDRVALLEMMRVINNHGFIVLSVPDPFHREVTIDWGYPKEEQHGHFRIYGKDINQFFEQNIGNEFFEQIVIEDPITSSQDYVFVISNNKRVLEFIKILIVSEYP